MADSNLTPPPKDVVTTRTPTPTSPLPTNRTDELVKEDVNEGPELESGKGVDGTANNTENAAEIDASAQPLDATGNSIQSTVLLGLVEYL